MSAPSVVRTIEPQYTDEARAAHAEGSVVLSLVVKANGKVDTIKVLRGLGHGLDEAAAASVAKWEFRPGMKDGQPVAVMATVEVNFRFGDRPLPRPESTAPGTSDTTPSASTSEQDEAVYQNLVERAKAGDLTIDWRTLRLACMKARSCQPRASKADLTLLDTPKLDDKLQVALRLIDEGFANMEAHASASGIYSSLGHAAEAQRELAITAALLSSILDQHDGKTKETAYEVITDREMYLVISGKDLPYFGKGVASSIVRDGPRRLSRWIITDAATDKQTVLFFNVDAFIDAKSHPR